jgi:hypothetical protein
MVDIPDCRYLGYDLRSMGATKRGERTVGVIQCHDQFADLREVRVSPRSPVI